MATRKFEKNWTYQDFIKNNIGIIQSMYITQYPERSKLIEEGEMEMDRDRLEKQKESIIGVMLFLYKEGIMEDF